MVRRQSPGDAPDLAERDREDNADDERQVGWPEITGWLVRHWLTLAAVALIIGQVAWKSLFLSHFYFRQDDFHFTELGMQYGLSWKYLSYVGSGHLHPGVLLLTWIMAKIALYNWAAATSLSIALLVLASLACWRLLRVLFGHRPAILIPLILYLVTPLTFPDDSWWSSAIESLPLQAAIFLAVTAHVHYVRTGRIRHVIAAACWLAVGLFFFEKAMVIPALLFAITAGFLVEGRLVSSLRRTLVWYWRAWAAYFVLVAGYLALLLMTLQKSTVRPAPTSITVSLTFAWDLIRQTFLPGLLGGPWNWEMTRNAAVAYAAPAAGFVWAAVLVTCAIVAVSIAMRARAWRAWAILVGWIVLADVVPIVLGRLATASFAQVLGLDTRYLADAAPVAAVCLGLAFWPVVKSPDAGPAAQPNHEFVGSLAWRGFGVVMTGLVIIGSVWSVNSYEQVSNIPNVLGRHYLANVKAALAGQPAGTVILDQYMVPYVMWNIYYGKYALQSRAVGPMASSAAAKHVRWEARPGGNIDKLMMFGPFGTLLPAQVHGTASRQLPFAKACWPVHHGAIVVRFTAPSSVFTGILRLGYVADPAVAGEVATISYGTELRHLVVEAGLHSAYLQVTGSASAVRVTLSAPSHLCVGDAQAGNLRPSTASTP